MLPPFPPEVEQAAQRHSLPPALAFGLGEGLNLFYVRREGKRPFRLHVLPGPFETTVAARAADPSGAAMAAALLGNAHGVLVCTGDPHGLDAIEAWAEELPFWPHRPGWEESLWEVVALIEASDGLYRRSYRTFLDMAAHSHAGLEQPRALLDEIADEWLHIAARLGRGDALERVAPRLLRMATLEGHFWGRIVERFQGAG